MSGGFYVQLGKAKKLISVCLIIVIVVSGLGEALLLQKSIPKAEAAQVTIDSDAQTLGTSHIMAGSQTVFVDDQTGYKFFRDAGGYCVYRKTTNAGSSWSATTTVDGQTDCHQIQVWYDKWTPGSASSSIHIITADTTGNGDLYYNRLDANDDRLLGSTPVNISTNSGNSRASLVAGANSASLTRGTDGTLYATIADATDSYIVECTINCTLTTSWTETGSTTTLARANDYSLLAPLPGGDIMLINRSISAATEDIRYKVWNNVSWSATWTNIDANATDNTTYDVGMSVAVSSTTPGVLYLAYADHGTLGATNDVRVARYNGSTWATSTDVISNSATRAITNVSIGLDASNDDVYVAYSARTTAGNANTTNVYWKWSTSSMGVWSAEIGPINTGADNLYGVDINHRSDERIFTSWFDVTDADIYSETLADVFPGIHATTTATQTASVTAGATDFYLGGKFVLFENYRAHDVTGVTITESGTIDAENALTNIKLLYEMDSTSPYNCASESYSGGESQFGSTDTNGFSGTDGVSSFSGTTVSVSTTSALCMYPVLDVTDSAVSSSTIELSINNPTIDIVVTDSTAGPNSAKAIASSTIVYNDNPTQSHFHFRNDNGSEAAATSQTAGTQDTALTAMRQGSTTRLRLEISNEGSVSTPAIQYRLEFAPLLTTCSEVSSWTNVGDVGGEFDMFDSSNLTDGANTTNIATGIGGMTDENTTFLASNAGVKDTSSQTADITLSTSQFVELEYSIQASSTVPQGNTYCFRVSSSGTSLPTYSVYPSVTINSDVAVTVATSSQKASTTIPITNYHVGSAFVVTENSNTRNVTSIMITEAGTVDGETGLDNVRLQYDLDATSPYNCAGESYAGGEAQFGSTDTDGFSGPNGTSTFTGSVAISTTSTMCLYTVFDVTSSASHGETVDITMESPSANLLVSGGGSVSPSITRDMNGSTTLVGAVLTQTHYHWRNDNGGEATSTSQTGGTMDTPITNISQTTPVRLRLQISNEGAVTSSAKPFLIEYGTKLSTCSAVSSWTDVGASGGAWDMYNSVHLIEGTSTTDIAEALGGVANENTTFLTPNSAVKDTSSTIATTTLTSTQFLEAEFSIQQTVDAGFDTAYCFRLASPDVSLNAYTRYPELTTSPERDFEIQRGTANFSAVSQTLTAGVDYIAPSASTSAFVRITNTNYTGAGDSSAGGTQASDDVTAYISNASNITSSFTISRPAGALATTTRVSWEIIEFIGEAGSDNEMIVRGQGNLTYTTTSLTATGTAISTVADDADVVVFITGQGHPDTGSTNYNSGQSTSDWLSSSNQPVFTRGVTGTDATIVSYAVVEFTGQNWFVQRSSHTYTSAGTTETEAITAVGSLSRTFLHAQKRIITGLTGGDEYGHEVWLSSIGQVSYFLQTGATTPSGQTSVAWVVENTQTSDGAMVVYRSNNNLPAGTPEPSTFSASINGTLEDITNASIFINNRSAETGTLFPRPIIGAVIASTTHYELWRSDTGTAVDYRTEVVEWPTAGLAVRQNYYRFYVDNNALDPTQPWPNPSAELGENTVLTGSDEPLGEGERIRIRMSLQAENATLPAETRSFRLQYAPMVTTCSAISEGTWATLGSAASSTIWRGYNATGTTDGTQLSIDPPNGGDLNLTVSDVAGTLEEVNDTGINAFSVQSGEDIEYDWIVEQNGANAETYYCFRMVEANGTPLDGYTFYPQIRTASFTPRTQNWRWYDDEGSETPVTALAGENISPVNIANGQVVKLRVAVKEVKNIARDDVRFRLQYSEYANFSEAFDVVASSSCTGTSTWCYSNGGGTDNAVITTGTLSDADSCIAGVGDGCGTHNETPTILTGFRHEANAGTEYEFTIESDGPRTNRVYFFRLYDAVQDIPVPINDGEAYPSLVTEGASLVFEMEGIPIASSIEGVTTDIETTPTSIAFGTVLPNTFVEGAHRMRVDTNGTQGYQLLMMLSGDFLSAGGSQIDPLTTTNTSPASWATGCAADARSCLGYHTGDDTLQGNPTRFSAPDTYARFSTTTLEEVSYTSQPAVNETTDIVFRLLVRELQDAGQYETHMRYISVPMF